MKTKDDKKSDNNSSRVKSIYDILDKDVTMTKEIPTGFTGIYLFIEGDIKDLRIVGLN